MYTVLENILLVKYSDVGVAFPLTYVDEVEFVCPEEIVQ